MAKALGCNPRICRFDPDCGLQHGGLADVVMHPVEARVMGVQLSQPPPFGKEVQQTEERRGPVGVNIAAWLRSPERLLRTNGFEPRPFRHFGSIVKWQRQ